MDQHRDITGIQNFLQDGQTKCEKSQNIFFQFLWVTSIPKQKTSTKGD